MNNVVTGDGVPSTDREAPRVRLDTGTTENPEVPAIRNPREESSAQQRSVENLEVEIIMFVLSKMRNSRVASEDDIGCRQGGSVVARSWGVVFFCCCSMVSTLEKRNDQTKEAIEWLSPSCFFRKTSQNRSWLTSPEVDDTSAN
jgi:hypothetical protein